jgi:hypothetical protein
MVRTVCALDPSPESAYCLATTQETRPIALIILRVKLLDLTTYLEPMVSAAPCPLFVSCLNGELAGHCPTIKIMIRE